MEHPKAVMLANCVSFNAAALLFPLLLPGNGFRCWQMAAKFSAFLLRPLLLPDGTAKRPTNTPTQKHGRNRTYSGAPLHPCRASVLALRISRRMHNFQPWARMPIRFVRVLTTGL